MMLRVPVPRAAANRHRQQERWDDISRSIRRMTTPETRTELTPAADPEQDAGEGRQEHGRDRGS